MSRLSLVVIYCSSIAESLRFYSLLGLDLVREQHGATGPVHYAATIDRTVLELYPAGDRPPSRVRLGVAVSDPAAVAARLTEAEYPVRDGVVTAPDGNRVVLEREVENG